LDRRCEAGGETELEITRSHRLKISSYTTIDNAESTDLEPPLGRAPEILQWVLVGGLCALLIFAILAFGAVDEWATFAFEAGAALLFLVWAARQVVSKRIRLSKNPLYLPALFFFGVVASQLGLRRSAYAYVTEYGMLQYISYGIVLLIGAECVRGERARRVFSVVMIIFGTCYAFFALAQELTANGKIFWLHSPQFHGWIYGSYVNHDHYAGVMEMLVPIPLVLSMGHLLRGAKRVMIGSCAVLMATTIFLSGSRGGMLAFVLEIILFAALTFGKSSSPRIALGSIAVCISVLSLLVFLGKGQVLERLGDLGPGIRLTITKDSLRMFAQRPIAGWGLGTFPTVYPSFRSFYTNLFINEAHNDYAQLLVETGVLGLGLMLWFLTGVFRNGLPKSQRWEFQWDFALSFAAFLGCTGILFHSFVDFNLQIPANAAFFYVLCGLAASLSFAELSKPKGPRSIGKLRVGVRETSSDNRDQSRLTRWLH
jgi:O-antigen ligase